MVDVKREDITLSDRTKGISADEFAWGSYFYAEAISSGYNTKGFELWYDLWKHAINNRPEWYTKALSDRWPLWFTSFTYDGMVEMEVEYNWNNKGAYYGAYIGDTYKNFYNGLWYKDNFYCIGFNQVTKIPVDHFFNESNQLLANPDLSSATGWTLGAWWTTTDAWAKHTTWNTATLVSDTFSGYDSSHRLRCAIKITWWTAWNITVKGTDINYTVKYNDPANWRYVTTIRWLSGATGITITPSSWFNGTIERVEIYDLDLTTYATISLTYDEPTAHTYRPALVWEWDLYVAAWSYVNIINIWDNGVTNKQLVDSSFNIVAMNQQAGNLIIWATDGHDSRQYYWNWVDGVATEVIEWKGLIIQSACGTETISYVLTTSGMTSWAVTWYEYRLYAVSWYQRSLLASKLYQFRSDDYLDAPHYNANKKFDFNDVKDHNDMVVFLDSLYIPGCDGIYKYGSDIPGLKSNWTKPIKYDTWATNLSLGQNGNFLGVAFTAWNTNYVSKVDNRLYQPTWYLVTEAIYRDKLSSRKALEKVKIWYKNVPSTIWNIKVYAIVDDTYFWRFRPTTTPTTRPTVWAIYNVANNTKAEVIAVDTTNGVITFRTTEDKGSYANLANTTLTKVSWTWDNSIAVGYNYDNMCLIKTIESSNQEYNSDLIFWKDFVNTYLPFRHKIQFVVELNSNNVYMSPEVYEISMNSDITDITL